MTIKQSFAPITRALNAFVRSFDEEYSCVLAPAFEADMTNDIIFYSCFTTEANNVAFREDFIRRFPACADFDIFTLSFLHELGHLETEWDMIDDREQRQAIKDNESYFALYNEQIATDWAGEYLTANHDTMKAWENKIIKKFQKTIDKLLTE